MISSLSDFTNQVFLTFWLLVALGVLPRMPWAAVPGSATATIRQAGGGSGLAASGSSR
jgi:hypothetical protein